MKRYICGKKEQIVFDGKRLDGEEESFAREVKGIFYFFPEFGDVEHGFPDFHVQLQFQFSEANGNGTCQYTREM